MAEVRTEGTRVYLDGVEPMNWGGGEMCEFASALTRTLACVGEDVAYHYVMGVTGVAFRFTIGSEVWNPGFYGFEGVAADVRDLIRRAGRAMPAPATPKPPTASSAPWLAVDSATQRRHDGRRSSLLMKKRPHLPSGPSGLESDP